MIEIRVSDLFPRRPKKKKKKKGKDEAIEVRMLRRRLSVKMEWHPRCPTKNLPVCSRQANELVQEWSMTNAVGCLTGKPFTSMVMAK